MSDAPQHQEAWDHKRAILEYEAFLEETFERIAASPVRISRRKQQFKELYEDPELWRDPESFKKLYEDLRKEIIALGAISVGNANRRLREKFGPNTHHLVEARI